MRVEVTAGLSREPRTAEHAPPKRVVIVGNGMTSWRLCHELVSSGASARMNVVVIGEERHPAYDRVRLTSLLAGASVSDLLLAEREWYERAGIELHLGETVTAIDRANHVVQSALRTLPYDRLVLATGSVPWIPPIVGADRPGVFVYRTIADLEAIKAYRGTRKRAAVIGGGLLGLEAAKAVFDLGLSVAVIESLPTLMPRQLDVEGGERLAARIRGLGVAVHTAKNIAGISADPSDADAHQIRFAEGGALAADLVIVAAGVRPASGLARAAGLTVGPRGAIVVDDRLQTSDESIYAIGECASCAGATFGLVAPGYQMARVLVANLTGSPASFAPPVDVARLKLLGVEVCSAGETGVERDGAHGAATTCHRRREIYRKLIVRSGCLVGAVGVGAWPGFDRVAQAVAERERVSPAKLRRFRRCGELWPEVPSAAALPDAALVCSCMQVTRGQIDAACSGGPADVGAVCRATGAASACGTCRAAVEELVGRIAAELPASPPPFAVGTPPLGLVLPGPRPERGARVLVTLAAFAVVVSGLFLLGARLSSWPFPRVPERALRLWSGYGALGLATLSLILPLRKRWRRFSAGSVPVWRAVHGGLGASTVALVVVHTGLHLGAHLNQALLFDYLAVVVAGAMAGIVYGASHRLTPVEARDQRRRWGRVHVVVLWPLPVLAALHVLAAYFY